MPRTSSNSTARVDSLVRSVRSRLVQITYLQGVVLAGTAALIIIASALFLDYLLAIRVRPLRVAISISALAFTVIAITKFLILPLVRSPSKRAIARRIDDSNPLLEERIETVTGWNTVDMQKSVRGSQAFVDGVCVQAETAARQIAPGPLVPTQVLRYGAIALAIVALLCTLSAIVRPHETWLLVRRFMFPLSNITLTQVEASMGDAFGIRNEPFDVEAMLNTSFRRPVTMTYRQENGREKSVSMAAADERPDVFVHRFNALGESFTYRIRSGDGITPLHKITAVDRPKIASVAFQITPPEYSKAPEVNRKTLPRHSRALFGSILDVRFSSTVPLEDFWVMADDGNRLSLQQGPSGQYLYRRLLTNSLSFQPLLIEFHGVENEPKPTCQLVVFEDAAPFVEISTPDSATAVQPDDEVDIIFYAEDDFGITEAELIVRVSRVDGSVETNLMSIALNDQEGSKVINATAVLDLKALNVDHGDELDVAVRVRDGRQLEAISELGDQAAPGETGEPNRDVGQEGEVQVASNAKDQRGKSETSTGRDQGSSQENQPAQQDGESQQTQKKSSQRTGKQLARANENENRKSAETSEGAEDGTQVTGQGQSRQSSDDSKGNSQQKQTYNPPDFEVAESPKSEPTECGDGQVPDKLPSPRWINTPSGVCKSDSLQLKVDRYAGEFEGQQRDKLALDIYGYLKRMGASLESGISLATKLLSHVESPRTRARWDWPQREQLSGTDVHVVEASSTAKELNKIAAPTPYRFMGLQLLDIHHVDLVPARLEISKAQSPTNRPDHVSIVVHHLERAYKKLTDLTAIHETAMNEREREKELLEIAVMYRLFVEDMPGFMGSSKPGIHSFSREFLEQKLSEEQLKAFEGLIARKRELLERLAALMAEDPILMERMMARTRLEVTTLPDQLTHLARRHRRQATYYKLSAQGSESQRLQIKNRLRLETDAEGQRVMDDIMSAVEKSTIWVPSGESTNTHVEVTKKLFRNVAANASVLRVGEASSHNKARLAQSMNKLKGHLSGALTSEPGPSVGGYLANRLTDVSRLAVRVHAWNQRDELLKGGNVFEALTYGRFAVINDTSILTHKFDGVTARMRRLPKPIPEMADTLMETLERELTPSLVGGYEAVKTRNVSQARGADNKTSMIFVKAEKECIKFVEAIIKELDSRPVQPMGSSNDLPNVDDMLDRLLAVLEHEARACDSLGIPCGRPTNIQIFGDWMGMQPGNAPGSGMGFGTQSTTEANSGTSPGQLIGEAMRAALAQSRLAEEELKNVLAGFDPTVKDEGTGPGPGVDEEPRSVDEPNSQGGRDWNILASTLDEGLVQDQDQQVPTQYRATIDAYFERLAKESVSKH